MAIWQFRSRLPEVRERLALKLIAVSFFALAAWVTISAARALLGDSEPRPSAVGVGLAAASLVVMAVRVWAKRRTGKELSSATVVADSTQTLLCTYLSAVLLAGLGLNAWLGWAWADSTAALVIADVAREGMQAWRGEQCDDCARPHRDLDSPAMDQHLLWRRRHRTSWARPGGVARMSVIDADGWDA